MSGGTKIILLLQIFAALIHPNKVLFINIFVPYDIQQTHSNGLDRAIESPLLNDEIVAWKTRVGIYKS